MRFNVTILLGSLYQAMAQQTILASPYTNGVGCTPTAPCAQSSSTRVRVNTLPQLGGNCSQIGGLCNRVTTRAITSTSKRVYRAQPVFIQPSGPVVEAVATTTSRARVPRYTNSFAQLPVIQPRPIVTQQILPQVTQVVSEPIVLQGVPQAVSGSYVSQPVSSEVNTLMVPIERKLTYAERRRLRRAARFAAQQGCQGQSCGGCASCGQNVNPAQVIQVPLEPSLTWSQRKTLQRAARNAARTNCAATGSCPYHVVKQVEPEVIPSYVVAPGSAAPIIGTSVVAAPQPAVTETKVAVTPAAETVKTAPIVEETTITLPSS